MELILLLTYAGILLSVAGIIVAAFSLYEDPSNKVYITVLCLWFCLLLKDITVFLK